MQTLAKKQTNAWIEEASKKKPEGDKFQWVMENRDGEAVGSIDTHSCSLRDGTFSYGVNVAYDHQGKGYASEAILMVLHYYFEELRYQKATVEVYSFNEPSVKLHESLGFTHEGTLRRVVYSQGQYFDALYYGMTVEEFWQLEL